MNSPIISLMTDFGEEDFFVPSLKAVIASIHPEAKVIDITHAIPSFDILAGSFILFAVYRYFPKNTIFVSVVDPGVGSSRKILLAESNKYFFIAPDNGTLSLVMNEEKDIRIREVNNEKYFLRATGVTFDGRDKMAPAAAWLSQGVSPEEFGPVTSQIKRISIKKPHKTQKGIQGVILYRDKFGNLITNIPSSSIARITQNRTESVRLRVKEESIGWKQNYSQGKIGEIFFIFGSLGLLEIAVREGSASKRLNISPGQTVELEIAGGNTHP